MKDLHPQFELLINYVDGNADAEMQKRAIELIKSDVDAADFYQSLQATGLAFDEIDEQQRCEVPQQTIDHIKAATPASVRATETESPADDNVTPLRSEPAATVDAESETALSARAVPVTYGKFALAASLFCGLVAGALLYSAADGLNPADDSTSVTTSVTTPVAQSEVPATVTDEAPEWIRLVADYHRLYVRETVTAGSASSAEQVSQEVSEVLQTDFKVPALEQHGMEFRRAQWLAIDSQPLLQLAYLPESGKPLAVCILKKDTNQDTPAEYGETGGMQYVHWQTGEHAVVIVGTVSPQQLQDINGVVQRELL